MRYLGILLTVVLVGCSQPPHQPQAYAPPQQWQPAPYLPPAPKPAPKTPFQPSESTYEGTWLTTRNLKLNGTMTCVATRQSEEKWQGRFFGKWQGSNFTYTVDFSGPPERLSGKAVIDGANYDWTGSMSNDAFNGSFTGDRYTGSFTLKKKL